ncbi:MAG: tetratricopeptide repeat protein [Dongiaceae bacterium]
MADIFKEVEEDLRREGLEKIWRRYAPHVIAAAVIVVLATAGVAGWRNYSESRQDARAREFAAAVDLVAQSNLDGASKAFEAIGGNDGYSALARFQMATLMVKSGDTAGAAAIYQMLSTDTTIDRPFRELAVVLGALMEADTADPADLTTRLAPLTADGNPWRYSALEITGLVARRSGDKTRAEAIFSKLADDPDAPQGLRARAAELLQAMKG